MGNDCEAQIYYSACLCYCYTSNYIACLVEPPPVSGLDSSSPVVVDHPRVYASLKNSSAHQSVESTAGHATVHVAQDSQGRTTDHRTLWLCVCDDHFICSQIKINIRALTMSPLYNRTEQKLGRVYIHRVCPNSGGGQRGAVDG